MTDPITHDDVVDRYSALARAALEGEKVVDCSPPSSPHRIEKLITDRMEQ